MRQNCVTEMKDESGVSLARILPRSLITPNDSIVFWRKGGGQKKRHRQPLESRHLVSPQRRFYGHYSLLLLPTLGELVFLHETLRRRWRHRDCCY
jgi:hypothetical protein